VPEGFGMEEKGVFPRRGCCCVWAATRWSSLLLVAAMVCWCRGEWLVMEGNNWDGE
jgi:hypothetical protein